MFILFEVWSFDYAKFKNCSWCPPDRLITGRNTQAWVGPIKGVNPLKLMLMKRMKPGPEHIRQYEAARQVLLNGLPKHNQ